MARSASRRRTGVNYDLAPPDCGGLLVAVPAGHFLVGAFERELRASFMIEGGRLPTSDGMAGCALGWGSALRELAAVYVLVTAATGRGGTTENDLPGRSYVGRPMALGTGNRPVRAFQRELSCGMVEADHVF